MFRKFQERLSAAASSAFGDGNSASESDVQRLQMLGNYSRSQAEHALRTNGGDPNLAAEWLLTQPPQQQQNNTSTSTSGNRSNPVVLDDDDDDPDLQRALERSHQELNPRRTAAMHKAAQAAESRAAASVANKGFKHKKNNSNKKKAPGGTAAASAESAWNKKPAAIASAKPKTSEAALLKNHHPDVKLIPKLSEKSTEEQILRTADRMKNYPRAVDTLHRALSMIQNDPQNSAKYRNIDTTSVGYQRSVAPAPGAADFLKAMQFSKADGKYLRLELPLYDPALLYLGISALSQTKLTPEYKAKKRQLEFVDHINSILNTKQKELGNEERTKRNAFLAKAPKEPPTGRGALVHIELTPEITVRRRFEGDDTVSDVLHWLAGTYGSVFYEHLLATESSTPIWVLVDCHRQPVVPVDVVHHGHWTLQYIGCWPSGRLQLRPYDDSDAAQRTVTNNNGNQKPAAAAAAAHHTAIHDTITRGLGSGVGTSSDDE